MVGDSMLEQSFVGLACLGWPVRDATLPEVEALNTTWLRAFWGPKVRLHRDTDRAWRVTMWPWNVSVTYVFAGHLSRFTSRAAALADAATASGAARAADHGSPHSVATADDPRVASSSSPPGSPLLTLLRSEQTLLLLGGFSWGLPARGDLRTTLDWLDGSWPRLLRERTLVAEQMPSHFPGGAYRPGSSPLYPTANSTIAGALCSLAADLRPKRPGGTSANGTYFHSPVTNHELLEFNGMLAEEAASRSLSLGVLPLAELYSSRGDAHIEHELEPLSSSSTGLVHTASAASGGRRDCLHLCVAPGVLDAMAMATLAQLAWGLRIGYK